MGLRVFDAYSSSFSLTNSKMMVTRMRMVTMTKAVLFTRSNSWKSSSPSPPSPSFRVAKDASDMVADSLLLSFPSSASSFSLCFLCLLFSVDFVSFLLCCCVLFVQGRKIPSLTRRPQDERRVPIEGRRQRGGRRGRMPCCD